MCYNKIMIFDHNAFEYKSRYVGLGKNKHNGAYYYSKEIVENIIPSVPTTYNWVTVNIPGRCYDHSIVFIHDNDHPEVYGWLREYKDLILVCSMHKTEEAIKKLLPMHKTVYLPMSVDVDYVSQFKAKHQRGVCYAGRLDKLSNKGVKIPRRCKALGDMPREELLAKMAKFKKVYASERTAIEAKVLGCEVLSYDPRYQDPEQWAVIDNSAAAIMLQEIVGEIECAKNALSAPTNQTTVTVIIPAYNAADTVKAAISSVPKSDRVDIIVVNDGSTDRTYGSILRARPNCDTQIFQNEKNLGVAATVNKGLDMATGDYIVLLGADDYFYPDKFLEVMDELDGTDLVYFDLDTNTDFKFELSNETKREYSGSVKFMRREFIGNIRNPENLKWGEDWEFYSQLEKKGPTEKFTHVIAKHYNWPREGSLTWQKEHQSDKKKNRRKN